MTDLALIKFEGKALEKLVETVSKGIGTLYKPVAIRKEAKAKAYEHLVMERAKTQALSENNPEEFEEIRSIERSIYGREKRRRRNIDTVVNIAAEQLNIDDEVSETPVNEDWTTRFFSIVGDISDDFVQTLWGRILAGEVKKPGSFSYRTLETLRNITTEEAELFVRLSDFAIDSFDRAHIFYGYRDILHKLSKIQFRELLLLGEIGLINTDFNLSVTHKIPKNFESFPIKYNDKWIILKSHPDNDNEIEYQCIVYTIIGAELLKLIEPKSNIKYIRLIKEYCEKRSIRVMMADSIKVPDGWGIKNEREIPD